MEIEGGGGGDGGGDVVKVSEWLMEADSQLFTQGETRWTGRSRCWGTLTLNCEAT